MKQTTLICQFYLYGGVCPTLQIVFSTMQRRQLYIESQNLFNYCFKNVMLTGETAWSWYRNSKNQSMTSTQFKNCTHSQCCCTRSMSDGNQNGYQLFIKRTHLRLCSSCGQFRTGLCSCVIRVSG